MLLTAINARTAPQPTGGYSQALAVEGGQRLIFISGQIPVAESGEVPADFASQCRLVWAHIRAQLAAAGMTTDNLVKVTTYLTSREYAEQSRTIRHEVLGEHRPALTVMIAECFEHAWLLEIEAIAAA